MSQYIISRPAIRDLEAISSYFAAEQVETGGNFCKDLKNVVISWSSFPIVVEAMMTYRLV